MFSHIAEAPNFQVDGKESTTASTARIVFNDEPLRISRNLEK